MEIQFIKEMGERIKFLREEVGYSREELAEEAEMSSKFLYEIEKGMKCMSVLKLLNLSEALNTSTDYILMGKSYYDNFIKKLDENSEIIIVKKMGQN